MPDLTSTDLLVAAAIIDTHARHGHPHLMPLADRLSKAAADQAPPPPPEHDQDQEDQ